VSDTDSGNIPYRDTFYSGEMPVELEEPSPFARLVAKRLQQNMQVIDIGCGNGRDSIFFLQMGFGVTALDGSPVAIHRLCQRESKFEINKNSFVLNFEDVQEVKLSAAYFKSKFAVTGIVIYARFFLHAISQTAQKSFFNWVSEVLRPGDLIFLEYRSPQLNIDFVMGIHFRRLVEANSIIDLLRSMEFEMIECDSSANFAPFKGEIAMVSRTIARKASCLV